MKRESILRRWRLPGRGATAPAPAGPLTPQQVVQRIVAWHHRSPLARRIDPSAVQAPGVVGVPFTGPADVVQQLLGAHPPDPTVPAQAAPAASGLAAQPDAGRIEPRFEAAEPLPLPAAPLPAAEPPASDDEPAIEILVLDDSVVPPPSADLEAMLAATPTDPDTAPNDAPPAQPLPAEADDDAPEPAQAAADAPAGPPSLAQRLQQARERSLEEEALVAPAAPSPADAAPAAVAAPPQPLTAAQERRLRRQLKPLATARLLPSCSPRALAAWLRRHGSLQPPPVGPAGLQLPAPEPAGAAVPLRLHAHTATLELDDRRIRVLVANDGTVLGVRAPARSRVAVAAGMAACVVFALGGWTGGRLGPAGTADTVAQAEPAASPASASASAPISATHPEGPRTLAHAAGHPTPDATEGAPSAASHPAGGGAAVQPHPLEPHPEPQPTEARPNEPHPIGPDGMPQAPRRRVALVGSLVPAIDPVTREQAKAVSEAARGWMAQHRPERQALPASAPPPTPPAEPTRPASAAAPTRQAAADASPDRAAADLARGQAPVYAVLAEASAERQTAMARLALMQSVRAQMAARTASQGEVMKQGEVWRAAWWPFASQAEAERARLLLAVRGVRTEVVRF